MLSIPCQDLIVYRYTTGFCRYQVGIGFIVTMTPGRFRDKGIDMRFFSRLPRYFPALTSSENIKVQLWSMCFDLLHVHHEGHL